MTKRTKAVRWTDEGTLQVTEMAILEPSPTEVQVAVQSVGICGSDLHFYRGDFTPKPGIVPGHEFGGVVTAVGKDVTHVQEGDTVGIEPLLSCKTCRYCLTGNFHACPQRALIGEKSNGGMSEIVTFPGSAAYKAPAGVDAELAALAEPLACSVHGFEKANLRSHETVLIIGAGSIGLTALIAAKAGGAHVLVLARHPHQQEAARLMGADEVIGDDEAGSARLEELSQQWAIDTVVETVGGHADTILVAQRALRPLGKLLLLGIFSVPTVQIDAKAGVLKEIEIIGSLCYSAPNGESEYSIALDMLAQYGEQARRVVTHRYDSLDDVNKAFGTSLDKSTKSIKVHINPNH